MPVHGFPQELIDSIVDNLSTDKSSLLKLLGTSPVFAERCRSYIYRSVLIRTLNGNLTDNSRLLHDLLVAYDTGRFVSTVGYKFESVAPREDSLVDEDGRRLIRVRIPAPPQPHHSPIPGKGPALSALVPELALRLPNVRVVSLEGLDASPLVAADAAVPSVISSPASLKKLAVYRSCWAGTPTTRLSRFIFACPHLTSLELMHVGLFDDAETASSSIPSLGAVDPLAGPSVIELTLTDRDHPFFYLIPSGYLSLRKSLRRLFVITDRNGYAWPNPDWPAIKDTISYFSDQLTVLFISPPFFLVDGYTIDPIVRAILNVPHLVLSFPGVMATRMWLEAIKRAAHRSQRLQKLDIVMRFEGLEFEMGLRPLGHALNSLVTESMNVRYIVADPTNPNDSGDTFLSRPAYSGEAAQRFKLRLKDVMGIGEPEGVQFLSADRDYDKMYVEFMEGGTLALEDD
ncbi:hypothetical protein BDZ89DRAFT_1156735 [Hymenopellis radicata]|nr:hypothetical protein BDZ89DRAFT_1156735 [Hymenopellis radicata]